jgi:hypothetical protein
MSVPGDDQVHLIVHLAGELRRFVLGDVVGIGNQRVVVAARQRVGQALVGAEVPHDDDGPDAKLLEPADRHVRGVHGRGEAEALDAGGVDDARSGLGGEVDHAHVHAAAREDLVRAGCKNGFLVDTSITFADQ